MTKEKAEEFPGLVFEEEGKSHFIAEREGKLQEGTLHPLEEGKSLDMEGEILEMKRVGNLALFRSHGRAGRATSRGPAVATTPRYREGWDRIFGTAGKDSLPN